MEENEIPILDRDGNKTRSIGNTVDKYLFRKPIYIAVSKSGNIFVAGEKLCNVTCLTRDGKVVYQYKHEDMACLMCNF